MLMLKNIEAKVAYWLWQLLPTNHSVTAHNIEARVAYWLRQLLPTHSGFNQLFSQTFMWFFFNWAQHNSS